MFSVVSPTNLGQLWWNLAHSFLNKFAATWCKRFPPHLSNVSTLPCETWNAHHTSATTALLGKLQNLSHLNRGLQIRKIWTHLITAYWEYCKRRCTKHASLLWMNWNRDWEWSGTSWITLSLRQPFVSGVVDSCRSLKRVLYTSLAIFLTRCY